MIRQTAAAVIAFSLAVVTGMIIAGIGSGDSVPSTTSPPAITTTSTPRAVFFGEGETVVGPVAIIAAEPFIDGTQLVVGFDIATLAPTADSADVELQLGFGSTQVVPPEELITVFLDEWLLTAATGGVPGGAANPGARSARFEVGDSFDVSSIDQITITSYAIFTPISATFELTGGESEPIAPGLTARLVAVTEQTNTIVQVELISQNGLSLDGLRVTGSGPGWLAAVREAEGRPRWNLTYDATTAPDQLHLHVEGSAWIAVETAVDVALPETS